MKTVEKAIPLKVSTARTVTRPTKFNLREKHTSLAQANRINMFIKVRRERYRSNIEELVLIAAKTSQSMIPSMSRVSRLNVWVFNRDHLKNQSTIYLAMKRRKASTLPFHLSLKENHNTAHHHLKIQATTKASNSKRYTIYSKLQ
jgi:hypothetical protein